MKKQYIDYVDFGKRIAKQRKKLGLSQKALAEMMDCSCGYISRVENGKSKPAFEFVVLLANKLGVGIDCFLPNTVTGTQIAKLELQEKWERCSPELIQFLNIVVDEAQEFEIKLRFKEERD